MKRVGECVALLLVAGLAGGCGGAGDAGQAADEPRLDQNAVAHPKHPDVYVVLADSSGSGGGTIWDTKDDGWFLSGRGTSGAKTKDGRGVGFTQVYDGTTDAGDKYIFELKVGEDEETKEVVYDGKETEIDVTDGVKIILKPKK